ncbi:MAG: hypothetical protein WAM14_08770 [Candidatus Nitrosopolaris sp.]
MQNSFNGIMLGSIEHLGQKRFIKRTEPSGGNKKMIKYSVTEKGLCTRILEPYEQIFPRKKIELVGFSNIVSQVF